MMDSTKITVQVTHQDYVQHRVFKPHNAKGRLPLVVFLHGAGDRESTPEQFWDTAEHVAHKLDYKENGFVVLVPQCKPGEIWNPHLIKGLIDTVVRDHSDVVDDDSVYLVGHSMGARGVWDTAFRYPHAFAGLVTIAGVGCYLLAHKIVHVPTMIVHGVMDRTVDMDESLRMHSALMAARKHLKEPKPPLHLITETFADHGSILADVFSENWVGSFIKNAKDYHALSLGEGEEQSLISL